jgi:type I restriction enzyme S subunit
VESKGQIVLKLKNILASGVLDYSMVNRIELSQSELATYVLQDGDFLFVRVNGSRNLVGKCAIFNDIGEPVAYNDHIIRVRLNDIVEKEYFYWYLLSDAGKQEIELHTSTAAGQFTISGSGLRDIFITLPSIAEQQKIRKFLDVQTEPIDRIIEERQNMITDLESYKKSLIFEVVTGKRKVV